MTHPLYRCVFIVLLFAYWTNSASSERQVNAGINDHYLKADYQKWVGVFESPDREVYDRRFQIVAAAGPKAGMVVADIGAGTGLFTRLFARAVRPGGKVVAVDISRVFVENILRTAREQGLENIHGLVNDQRLTGLAPDSVDLAFVCDTYHHFEYPRTMLTSIRRSLKPGGVLVIIDFQRIPGVSSPWIIRHVRAGKQEVIKEITAAGFELIADEKDLLRSNYFLKFRKPSDETP